MRDSLDNDLHRAGYDQEEEYFYRLNRTLLDEMRAKRQASQSQEAWWMHCPHCGGEMHERDVAGLKGDVCSGCGGVFLDPAELGHLTVSHEPQTLKSILKSFFVAATKPRPSGVGQFPV